MDAKTVNDVIDHLAAKLAVPVQHLWGVLVRQTYVEAGESVAFSIIVGVLIFYWWRLMVAKVLSYKPNGYGDDNDAWEVVVALSGGALAICAVIALVSTVANIGYCFNPEAYALQQVLSTVK